MNVLIVCHKELVPPIQKKIASTFADNQPWRTEFFVYKSLEKQRHNVFFCGVTDSLKPIKTAIEKHQIDVVFNLLEEFAGERILEPLIASYFENLNIPYTGCGPLGLILAKNKRAAKRVLRDAHVRVPQNKAYPKIVKLVDEESSMGINKKSVVYNHQQLQQRTHKLKAHYARDVMTESYIEGRELHIAILQHSPRGYWASQVWETTFGYATGPRIITERLKWDFAYRDRLGVCLAPAKNLDLKMTQKIQSAAVRACRALSITGYARVDIRLTADNTVYVIEVNPNPDIAYGDEFAECAKSLGFEYNQLIQFMLEQAVSNHRTQN